MSQEPLEGTEPVQLHEDGTSEDAPAGQDAAPDGDTAKPEPGE